VPSAVCLGCGARVDEGAPCACDQIGDNPYRDAAPSSRAVLGACPRCSQALAQVDYAETPLDECGGCGGVFVEAWILDRLVAAREARISLSLSLPVRTLHRERQVRYLRCPRCSTQMNRKIFGRSSGVVVDICKSDGIWFDSGELASVLEFIECGGLERAQQREVEEREEELRRARIRESIKGAAPMPNPSFASRSELAAELVGAIITWWKT
jgi:Zn-finger nucleic acid-binding protein